MNSFVAVKKNDDMWQSIKNEIDNELGVSYVYPKIGHTRRFKRATLEKQGRELVFTHDEQGEIFRVAVNRNQSGELEYSAINVREVEIEDIQLWQKAERVLQQIIEEKQQQERRQSKGISLACDGTTQNLESSIKSGVCHCHKSYLEPLRLLQAAADTPLRRLEVKISQILEF